MLITSGSLTVNKYDTAVFLFKKIRKLLVVGLSNK